MYQFLKIIMVFLLSPIMCCACEPIKKSTSQSSCPKEIRHNASMSIYNKDIRILEYFDEDKTPSETQIFLQLDSMCSKIDSFESSGSFITQVESVSKRLGKDNKYRIIILTSTGDRTGKSFSQFDGQTYNIAIFKVTNKVKLELGRDEQPLKNLRTGTVGTWDDGKKESFKYSNMRSIKKRMAAEGY